MTCERPHCHGTLFPDEWGDWRCLLCARPARADAIPLDIIELSKRPVLTPTTIRQTKVL